MARGRPARAAADPETFKIRTVLCQTPLPFMKVRDSIGRFSSRVDNYVRYRPGYPEEVSRLLRTECGLAAHSVVADIASGTGIFTRMLLEQQCRVFGVEPNSEMRKAGEQFLAHYSCFTSVDGTAEATTLPDRHVDIVTAAQAAHWFDLEKAHAEFLRILKPGGWVVFLWNARRAHATPFLRDYDNLLLTWGTDYQDVQHERTSSEIPLFFAPSCCRTKTFSMRQEFDYAALEGRLLSSSYTPPEEHPHHKPMLHELRRIFDAHQTDGRVALEYDTRVYYGKLE